MGDQSGARTLRIVADDAQHAVRQFESPFVGDAGMQRRRTRAQLAQRAAGCVRDGQRARGGPCNVLDPVQRCASRTEIDGAMIHQRIRLMQMHTAHEGQCAPVDQRDARQIGERLTAKSEVGAAGYRHVPRRSRRLGVERTRRDIVGTDDAAGEHAVGDDRTAAGEGQRAQTADDGVLTAGPAHVETAQLRVAIEVQDAAAYRQRVREGQRRREVGAAVGAEGMTGARDRVVAIDRQVSTVEFDRAGTAHVAAGTQRPGAGPEREGGAGAHRIFTGIRRAGAARNPDVQLSAVHLDPACIVESEMTIQSLVAAARLVESAGIHHARERAGVRAYGQCIATGKIDRAGGFVDQGATVTVAGRIELQRGVAGEIHGTRVVPFDTEAEAQTAGARDGGMSGRREAAAAIEIGFVAPVEIAADRHVAVAGERDGFAAGEAQAVDHRDTVEAAEAAALLQARQRGRTGDIQVAAGQEQVALDGRCNARGRTRLSGQCERTTADGQRVPGRCGERGDALVATGEYHLCASREVDEHQIVESGQYIARPVRRIGPQAGTGATVPADPAASDGIEGKTEHGADLRRTVAGVGRGDRGEAAAHAAACRDQIQRYRAARIGRVFGDEQAAAERDGSADRELVVAPGIAAAHLEFERAAGRLHIVADNGQCAVVDGAHRTGVGERVAGAHVHRAIAEQVGAAGHGETADAAQRGTGRDIGVAVPDQRSTHFQSASAADVDEAVVGETAATRCAAVADAEAQATTEHFDQTIVRDIEIVGRSAGNAQAAERRFAGARRLAQCGTGMIHERDRP